MRILVFISAVFLFGCTSLKQIPKRSYSPCTSVNSCAKTIHDAIASNLHIPNGIKKGKLTKLTIKLSPNGNLKKVRILESSGYDTFDAKILDAVKYAAPFTEINGLKNSPFEKYFQNINLVFHH